MEDGGHVTEKIWSLTLEILCLLSGENFPPERFGDHVTITVTPPPSLTPERFTLQKILEVANKITELLTGEVREAGNCGKSSVSGGCQDVALNLSIKNKESRKGNELHKAAMMEDQPLPLSPGGSPRPLHSQDSTLRVHTSLHSYQSGSPCDVSIVEMKQEEEPIVGESECSGEDGDRWGEVKMETFRMTPAECEDGVGVRHDGRCEEEESSAEIGADGRYTKDIPEEHPAVSADDDITPDSAGGIPVTPNFHPGTHMADQSSNNDTFGDCFPSHSPPFPLTYHMAHRQPIYHQGDHTRPIAYSCFECGKCFPYKSVLIRHQMSHAAEKPYSCYQCGKCFTTEPDLMKHYSVHAGETPYSCPYCGKCFTTKWGLITHERFHTGEKPYSCSECGKCFPHKSQLTVHGRVHAGTKPYSCSECGKSFTYKSVLIQHRKVHTGEKPYSCSECGKCVSQKSDLIKHERLHTGEKPFSCLECGKRFSEKCALINHERIHTGEKPYSCSECGKRFAIRSSLIKHERVHTGERPYSCSECGKRFSAQSGLVRHERVHTGEKPYGCSSCGKCFVNKSHLVNHVKVHAAERPSTSGFGKIF